MWGKDLHDSASRIMIESCMRRTRAERHGMGRKRAKKTWNTPEEFLSSLRGEGFVSSRRGCVRWNTCRRLGHPNGQYLITISCFPEFFSSSTFTDPARLQLYQAILELGTWNPLSPLLPADAYKRSAIPRHFDPHCEPTRRLLVVLRIR